MKFPGFTAEASLLDVNRTYSINWAVEYNVRLIYPANYVDQSCYGNCRNSCDSDCVGKVGNARSGCHRSCANDCRETCTRPGSDPSSTSSTPTGSTGGSQSTSTTPPGKCQSECEVKREYWVPSGKVYSDISECNMNCHDLNPFNQNKPHCELAQGISGYQCNTFTEHCETYWNCCYFEGKCTGSGWFIDPSQFHRQCVISASGHQKCCTGWNQYPWIKECGRVVISEGCGFCMF